MKRRDPGNEVAVSSRCHNRELKGAVSSIFSVTMNSPKTYVSVESLK